jgi:5-methyltetrahydropteroyltriglutamate--homocysteine methyltransferase
VIGIHLCRGNYRSQHFASGGYAPVAQTLFANLDVDVYFLEYDDERSGDFAPLRHLPLGKFVVMGLMSSKNAQSDDEEVVLQRIEAASKELQGGLGQMCLSHQCGFSSTEEGNELTEEDQWRKIRQMVKISEKVWSI